MIAKFIAPSPPKRKIMFVSRIVREKCLKQNNKNIAPSIYMSFHKKKKFCISNWQCLINLFILAHFRQFFKEFVKNSFILMKDL